ncbi:cytochrome P450 [Sorangium sp. So ce1097]|uniref:cytochrome P450 n=1 Tax=Sorangium sp. So ce1097 TaxID=3133330 RepID=UPI003F61E6E3
MAVRGTMPRYDLLSPEFFANPHPTLQRMRIEDPVYWDPLLNVHCLTRYEDVQVVLRDPRFSAERVDYYISGVPALLREKLKRYDEFISHWMVLADPPRHTRLRSLVARAFTPQVVEGLRPLVQRVADEMIDAAAAGGRMDILRDLAYPLPGVVIGRLLGMSPEDTERLKRWSDALFRLLGAPVPDEEIIEAGHQGVVGFEGFLRDLIRERRAHPGDDVLSRLLLAEEQGSRLSDVELVSTCALLIASGHETTTHLIGNGALALIDNPDQMRELRDNPQLIDRAVEEILRYNGVAYQSSRRAREDVEIGGVRIEAGQIAFGFLHAANRDPARFPDPDRLDIQRKDTRHVAFGGGIHFCLGAHVARVQAQVVLNTIVQRLPNLELAEPRLEWIPSLLVRGLRALPVRFSA